VAANKRRDRKGTRWRLVIDTSILSAATDRESEDPIPGSCAKLLTDVYRICHQVVFTSESLMEWNNRRSNFAKRWRVWMEGEKKVHRLDDSCRDEELRGACERLFSDGDGPDVWEEVEKDLHLVEAALATDKIVLSLERRIYECFQWACSRRGARILGEIYWFNPVHEAAEVRRLLNGDLPQSSRLGS
jgi:hypothetical protein